MAVAGVGLALVGLGGAAPAWLVLTSHGLVVGRAHAVLLGLLLILLGWGVVRRRAVVLGGDFGRLSNGVRNGVCTGVAGLGYDGVAHLHLVPGLDVGTCVLVVVLVGVGSALRAAPAPPPSDDLDRELVRRMVGRADADTLAPFALRSDKTYLFSPDGRAAVGYRVLLGVAVVGGDPAGEPDAVADVVARFLDLCDRRGWRPAVLGARGDLVGLWAAHGLRSVGIGAEVVLDVASFGLATRRMRNVRQAVRRTHDAGARTTILRAADVPAELRAEMAALSRRWLGSNRERGFSMILDGLFDDPHPTALFVLAFDPAGRLVGFQRYLPVGDSALSLDVMRRTRQRLNGLNERMIVDVVDHARRTGLDRVSLNFAAFRELLDRPAAERGPAERVGYRLLHLLDPLIKVESLYLFNAKFGPATSRAVW